MKPKNPQKRFHVILIKPSKYDDDGYVIRWWRGMVTSNSLACMHALTMDAVNQKVLGEGTQVIIHCFDETVQKIPVRKLSRKILKAGERGIVCMVGVQSNQYPRALDLALEFKKEGLPVMIGGFHVSGCFEMIPERTPEIQEAIDSGITLVAGEVEQRWGELLKAAYEGMLEPIYNFIDDKPSLQGVPGPLLPNQTIDAFLNQQTSFDAGRGCPFHCTFCTIINIQGNEMRGRTADDIEKLVRANYREGHTHIFITDDNFARHKDWEKICDRLIEMKDKEGIRCSIMIQTDTLAHKIPRFIEKTTRAGCRRVFIGLETVNPQNLLDTGKRQNRLEEYRRMLQAWRDHGAITLAGYIIGFPGDTYESIMRDVEYLKRELPLDQAEFFLMTPLPGSVDHQRYYKQGVPMEPDLNLYDTAHPCIDHPNMTREEWARAYVDAWKSFYSREHVQTLLLRRKGPRRRLLMSSTIWFRSAMFIEKVHPLLSGYLRFKGRKNRRRGYPIEPFLPYYLKRAWEISSYPFKMAFLALDTWLMFKKACRPENANYMDAAITPEPPAPSRSSTVIPIPSAKPTEVAATGT